MISRPGYCYAYFEILFSWNSYSQICSERNLSRSSELTNYGTTPETAPVHEVPELTNYGATPETAPVHEVPELTNYGTTPETAPVHEVPRTGQNMEPVLRQHLSTSS